MINFTYTKPKDLNEAVVRRSKNQRAKFIGGGTNILDLMKENVERPSELVDLNSLPLREVSKLPSGGLRVGALVSNSDAAYHPEIERHYPVLSKAILTGASAQLRNMATTGGNLLQRTRCYYFYDVGTPCNKRDPGSGCGALQGKNRIHAILGTSDKCIAVHPSDMCVALAVLEANIEVIGTNGKRTIAMKDFHRLPGETPHIDTTLKSDEVITAVDLPKKGFAKNFTYLKLRDRQSYAFALVSVAAVLEMDGESIREARVALGGVAHKPWRDPVAESFLKDQKATHENFLRFAGALLADAKGYGDNTFKIELAKRAIVRALKTAAKMEDQA